MSTPCQTERRDPASGVLRLGTVLTETRTLRLNGSIVVRDKGRRHLVQIAGGNISDVTLDGPAREVHARNCHTIRGWVEQLFVLPRPHVLFEPGAGPVVPAGALDSKQVILKGVRKRPDLFDPVVLARRIPVATLSINPEAKRALSRLDLTPSEQRFVAGLTLPTPIPMALWKRGLSPREAGALVVALNLLGAFENWRPGFLPRLSTEAAIRRRISEASDDHALLGIEADAPCQAVDNAFRKLSLSLR